MRNETETKAALKALEVFESLPDTDSLSIREKNRILNQACRSYAGMAAREKEYQLFWQQKNGYFDGHWWQDKKKRDEAIKMLRYEIRDKGTIDLRQPGFSGQTRKIELLEELVNIGSKTGEWGNPLLTGMENSLAAMNMNRNPYTLDRETLEALKNRHDANAWKAFNHWLENGGTEIILGAMILGTATGVRIHSDIQAKKETAGAQGVSEAGIAKDIKYSPVNPGPLKESVANSFNGATYTQKVLTEDTVMYRVHGGQAGEVGSYLSRTPQGGGLQSQLDLALNPSWGNTTENVSKVIVPKGTVIYEGIAAPQNIFDSMGNVIGTLPGGGNQIYIPKVDSGWFK
ncbi:MAG: hypothetical protein Q4F83_02990 [Eubacteriales bacterium]|nr:hypothetical protein [Eubacteriales bacterium]